MTIFAISNQKGGIGKTTTCVNTVLYASQEFRIKTGMLDLDAQKNTTNSLVSSVPASALLASAFFQEKLPENRSPIKVNPYLDLFPGDKRLKLVDSMVSSDDRASCRDLYQLFRENVRRIADNYELFVIDTPTTAEHRYLAALVAANFSLTPTTVDAFGMDGVSDLKESLREVRSLFGNPTLKDMGIMPNKVEKRSRLHAENIQKLAQAKVKLFPETVYRRLDVENKLNEGKRSPVMRPAVVEMLKQMNLIGVEL